jgi:hypothetical protein
MTFIEVHANEEAAGLEKLIKDAFIAVYAATPPRVGFGRVIVWKGRMFQELQLSKKPDAPRGSYEDSILNCWRLPHERARLQLGSMQGEVFTSPPEAGAELAARIREGGRCGREYVVRSFRYYDYHGDT